MDVQTSSEKKLEKKDRLTIESTSLSNHKNPDRNQPLRQRTTCGNFGSTYILMKAIRMNGQQQRALDMIKHKSNMAN